VREGRVQTAAPGEYGVGMVFLPRDPANAPPAKDFREDRGRGRPEACSAGARADRQRLARRDGQGVRAVHAQVFIGRNPKLADDMAFERKLYVIRKRA
jgi:glutamate synthase domain-containing protein 1